MIAFVENKFTVQVCMFRNVINVLAFWYKMAGSHVQKHLWSVILVLCLVCLQLMWNATETTMCYIFYMLIVFILVYVIFCSISLHPALHVWRAVLVMLFVHCELWLVVSVSKEVNHEVVLIADIWQKNVCLPYVVNDRRYMIQIS